MATGSTESHGEMRTHGEGPHASPSWLSEDRSRPCGRQPGRENRCGSLTGILHLLIPAFQPGGRVSGQGAQFWKGVVRLEPGCKKEASLPTPSSAGLREAGRDREGRALAGEPWSSAQWALGSPLPPVSLSPGLSITEAVLDQLDDECETAGTVHGGM